MESPKWGRPNPGTCATKGGCNHTPAANDVAPVVVRVGPPPAGAPAPGTPGVWFDTVARRLYGWAGGVWHDITATFHHDPAAGAIDPATATQLAAMCAGALTATARVETSEGTVTVPLQHIVWNRDDHILPLDEVRCLNAQGASDHTLIQDGLNRSAATGRVLALPPRTEYGIDQTLIWPEGAQIDGCGSTLRKDFSGTDAGASPELIRTTDPYAYQNGGRIEHLTLDGNAATGAGGDLLVGMFRDFSVYDIRLVNYQAAVTTAGARLAARGVVAAFARSTIDGFYARTTALGMTQPGTMALRVIGMGGLTVTDFDIECGDDCIGPVAVTSPVSPWFDMDLVDGTFYRGRALSGTARGLANGYGGTQTAQMRGTMRDIVYRDVDATSLENDVAQWRNSKSSQPATNLLMDNVRLHMTSLTSATRRYAVDVVANNDGGAVDPATGAEVDSGGIADVTLRDVLVFGGDHAALRVRAAKGPRTRLRVDGGQMAGTGPIAFLQGAVDFTDTGGTVWAWTGAAAAAPGIVTSADPDDGTRVPHVSLHAPVFDGVPAGATGAVRLNAGVDHVIDAPVATGPVGSFLLSAAAGVSGIRYSAPVLRGGILAQTPATNVAVSHSFGY